MTFERQRSERSYSSESDVSEHLAATSFVQTEHTTSVVERLDSSPFAGSDEDLAGFREPSLGFPIFVQGLDGAKGLKGGSPLVSNNVAQKLGNFQFANDIRTSVPLILADALAVIFSLGTAWAAILLSNSDFTSSVYFNCGLVLLTLAIQHIHGLYPAVGIGNSIEFRRILRTCLMVSLAAGLSILAKPALNVSSFISYILFAISLWISMPIFRAIARRFFGRFSWWTQSVVVVGDGPRAEAVFQNLSKCRDEGLRPIGIAYDPVSHWEGNFDGARIYLGPATALEQILLSTRSFRVVIAKDDAVGDFHFGDYCNIPHISLQTPWLKHPTEKANLVERHGATEIHCYQRVISPSALFAKRCLDLTIVLMFAPVLIPIFATLAGLIKASSPGPVFYGQKRIGKNGKEIKVWKFRSMVPNADAVLSRYLLSHPELLEEWKKDHKLKKDPRITTVGRFLRKTSLDELPQLWNVFCGEMSLVGPRPIVNEEIAKYKDVYNLYTLVRPGITGLWQISGRNNTTYEQRLHYDRFYVQNWSCMMDLYILYRTAKTAVLQEGAY